MAWIKRNLYFLIGSLVALALMVVGGFMLYSRISEQAGASDEIDKQFQELQRLVGLNPNPGDSSTIDNVKTTKDQEIAVRGYIGKIRPFFERITPIPDPATNRISNADFAAQLRIAVSQLHHDAELASVQLPPNYYFTFEAQRKIMNFDPASIDNLATHLGDIKVISESLFDAKINSLDSIRREAVSANDNNTADYLPMKTVSTPLADHVPYEITFRCFSAELALVLANFANSHYGFVVKAINIEPAAVNAMTAEGMSTAMTPGMETATVAQPPPPGAGMDPREMAMRRRAMVPGGVPPAGGTVPAPASTGVSKNGQEVLRENPFRVTLLLDLVKLKGAASATPAAK